MKKRVLTTIIAITAIMALIPLNAFAASRVDYPPTLSVDKSTANVGDTVTYTVKLKTPAVGDNYRRKTFYLKTTLPEQVQLLSATFSSSDETGEAPTVTIGPGHTSDPYLRPNGNGNVECWSYKLDLWYNASEHRVELVDVGRSVFNLGGETFTISIKTKVVEAGNPKQWFTKTEFHADDKALQATIGEPEDPNHTHRMVYCAASTATCTKAGNTAHYQCTDCGRKYKDEAGTKRVYNTTVNALGHDWQKTLISRATLSSNGKLATHCRRCGLDSEEILYVPKTFALSATDFTYNGGLKKPSVIVTDASGKRVTSFTVAYANNKNIGTARATVTFNGYYSGSKVLAYRINPAGTKLTRVVAAKKSFTAKWKKQAKLTNGYQIQYSTNSKFASGNKIVTIKKNKTMSRKVSKLKAKKKYYVRVRTYKVLGGQKYYSTWSKARTVKTK